MGTPIKPESKMSTERATDRAENLAQVAERLPSKGEALSTNPAYPKKPKLIII
jgi:hypothetical protein